ncbi:MAG TPA: DNRLRE domain-containing protein, partial [Kofleriaceae bacterium]|nr:DNRLRE domain-containing protein [Kofleriaceae bacterium]
MRYAVLLAVFLTGAAVARADTVVIAPTQDTTIYSEDGALSNGKGQHLFAGTTSSQSKQRRALIQFGVTGAIPAGSTINSVTLTMRLDKTQANTAAIALYKVTAAWGEGASTATGEEGGGIAAAAGDATWTMRSSPSVAWTSAGGDAVATASATTSVGSAMVDYTWSGAAMVADVQSWLDAPAGNYGWLVRAPTVVAGQAKRFA